MPTTSTDAQRERATQLSSDSLDDVVAPPLEIERKYLLRELPPLVRTVPSVLIEQGWLPGNLIRERLRRSTDAKGNARYTRTIKHGALGSRFELEEACDDTLFEALWPLTRAARIRKHRHRVPSGDHVWEIDVFVDRALVIAEIELRSDDDAFDIPAWLAPYVTRDVSDDPAFANSSMATSDLDV